MVIMNKSKVVSLSLHHSGKILLALYANGMLRLWNMMTARCTFKRKVGLLDETDELEESEAEEGEEGGEDELLEVALNKKDLSEQDRSVVEVKWEPKFGKIYAILFRKMLEVYAVEDEKACTTAVFDVIATSFDFIGANQICVANENGNFTILKNIQDNESI
jgi:hypothetical protein